MSDDDRQTVDATRPALRIVRGNPSAEDIAALTALVLASSGDVKREPTDVRGGWRDPARTFRRPLIPGPNAWRSSGW